MSDLMLLAFLCILIVRGFRKISTTSIGYFLNLSLILVCISIPNYCLALFDGEVFRECAP